jgi:hypothetical protein
MNFVSRLVLGSFIGLLMTVHVWGSPQWGHSELLKPTKGRVINAVVGDRACYLTIKNDDGRLMEVFANFEVCEQGPSLISQQVAFTYKTGEVNSASCGGEPVCSSKDQVPLVIRATILAGSKPKPPPASTSGHLCSRDEVVVFSCRTGAKAVSVCASGDASPTSGYLQYRFGKPGSPEMILPLSWAIPPHAATGAAESYSGGGAAWLRFKHGGYGYVVYTGIGRWGDRGEARDVAGLVVEQPQAPNRHMDCAGKPTSLLGPAWFEAVGIGRGQYGGSFGIPAP